MFRAMQASKHNGESSTTELKGKAAQHHSVLYISIAWRIPSSIMQYTLIQHCDISIMNSLLSPEPAGDTTLCLSSTLLYLSIRGIDLLQCFAAGVLAVLFELPLSFC